MSPAFLGKYAQYECPQCTCQLRVTIDERIHRNANHTLWCPHCQADLTERPFEVSKGDVCTIEPVQTLRRWDVVAARAPHHADRVLIKRIVGLPGETISIRDGDVFADGRRLQKSLDTIRQMAVLVHDSNYDRSLDRPTAWFAEQNSAWKWKVGQWHVEDESTALDNPLRFVPPVTAMTVASTSTKKITDYNRFDPFTSRPLNYVGDILLTLQIELRGAADFRIAMNDGWHEWDFEVEETAGLRLRRDGAIVEEKQLAALEADRYLQLELATIDGRMVIGIDSKVVLLANAASHLNRQIPQVPIQIFGNSDMAFVRAMVHRDVYYVPYAAASDFRHRLEADEYFLLGDYGYASIDSRHDQIGAFQRTDVLGTIKLQKL